jgi:uncharacterized protein
MIAFLVRFLIYVATVLLLGRLLRSFFRSLTHGSEPRTPHDTLSGRTVMVKDPMCGMYMDPRLAVRMQHNKEEFYFCSDECRQKFLAASN